MRLRIEKSIYGGAGLARAEGKAIFVPLTLPGETVEAHVIEGRKSFASAALDAVTDPAPERAEPPCPYFGTCGGCHYQHAVYAAQVAMKRTILAETLERAGLGKFGALPAMETAAAEPLGYRNRIRLHVQARPFALCYKERGSHRNLAVEICPIAAPLLQEALRVLRGHGDLLAQAAEVELFTNAEENALLLTVWGPKSVKLDALCRALAQQLPLQGAALMEQERQGRQTGGRRLAGWRETGIEYRVGAHAYSVGIGSFFQVNRFLLERLVALAAAGDRGGALAWDLYSGVGLFTRLLLERFARVVAVEAASGSFSDLRRNVDAERCQAVQRTTLDFLRKHAGETPGFVLVDPPRAGLGDEVTKLLAKAAPRQITYVSCDPATLARDLRELLESGYRIQRLTMADLFPQTYHIESVVELVR